MMEHRFACTACGKCCSGWIPLTIADALKHAERFPIAMVWTPIGPTNPAFNQTSRLFTTCRSPKGGQIALRIVATAYLPPSFPCPELTADFLCGIHPDKPLRCRTMPFFPYRDERQQEDLLRPRAEWDCDISDAAPVVYRNGRIADRTDFHSELNAIRKETPVVKKYADGLFRAAPRLAEILAGTLGVKGGNVILGFPSLLETIEGLDIADVAQRQLPVLKAFAERTHGTPELADYHRRYTEWADEFARLVK